MIYLVGNEETLGWLVVGFVVIGLPAVFITYTLGYEVDIKVILLSSVIGAILLRLLNKKIVSFFYNRKLETTQQATYQTPGKYGAVFRDLTISEYRSKLRDCPNTSKGKQKN